MNFFFNVGTLCLHCRFNVFIEKKKQTQKQEGQRILYSYVPYDPNQQIANQQNQGTFTFMFNRFPESNDCLLPSNSLYSRHTTRHVCHLGLFSIKISTLHVPLDNVYSFHNLQVSNNTTITERNGTALLSSL